MKVFMLMMAAVLMMLPIQHSWATDSLIEIEETGAEIELECPIEPYKKKWWFFWWGEKTDFTCLRQQIDFACEEMKVEGPETSKIKEIACDMQRYNNIKQKVEKLIAGELTIDKEASCWDLQRSYDDMAGAVFAISYRHQKYLRQDQDFIWWVRGDDILISEISSRCP